jgi:hypothetical protein
VTSPVRPLPSSLPLRTPSDHASAIIELLKSLSRLNEVVTQLIASGGGGGGGGAPIGAGYIVDALDATLTAERVLSAVAGQTNIDYGTPGVARVGLTPHLAAADPHPQYALDTDLAGYTPTATFNAHHARHEPGGADPMAVDAVAATGSLRTLGAGAQQAAAGTDARFTDARTPLAHKVSHQSGGTDQINVGGLSGLLADPQTALAHTHVEADVVGLVADLATRMVLGQLIGSTNPGTMTLANSQYSLHYSRLTLSGAGRLSSANASRSIVTDLGSPCTLPVLGTPKCPAGSFRVPTDYQVDMLRRLTLTGPNRANLEGTSDLIVTDDFGTRSRIVLAGRG